MQSWRVAAVIAVVGFGAGLFAEAAAAAQTGKASYYRHGKRTANGERFNPHDYTAAHRTLPFGTRVLVTNLKNGKSVIVRINDRGPHVKGRIIDLSLGAAHVVGLTALGITQVKIVPLGMMAAASQAPAAAPVAANSVAEAAAQGVPLVLVPPGEATPALQ
jgi:rare lipoprotein A